MKQPLRAPVKHAWPMTFDEATSGPVDPKCPTACAFRVICPTWIQEGTVPLWESGRLQQPRDCVHFERLEKTHFETTGRPVPATAEALLEQLGERKAIQGEQESPP